MKILKYKFCTKVNYGTEEEPNIVEDFSDAVIKCETQAVFDANYPIAEKEAVPGTIDVTGEFDPEPTVEPTDAERISELEEALELLLSGDTR